MSRNDNHTDPPVQTPPTAVNVRVPVGMDPARVSVAGVYDAFLGGKHHYAIHRAVRARVLTAAPDAARMFQAEHDFALRACRFLTGIPTISQFLIFWPRYPGYDNPHQVIQRINPDARVLYLDDDSVVLAHASALLADNDNTHVVDTADCSPRHLFEHDALRRYLDLTEPVAVIHVGTLEFLDTPHDVLADLIDRLPTGSYVAASHFCDPDDDTSPLARDLGDALRCSPLAAGTFRVHKDIDGLLAGLDILPPGTAVECARWYPNGPQPQHTVDRFVVGAVAVKR
jgi:hypothetical protein